FANPLDATAGTRPTDTLSAREVFHATQARIRPLTSGIQTQEQLDTLLQHLDSINQTYLEESQSEQLRDPTTQSFKGRPRSQRLTGVLEGRARGGGGSRTRGMRGLHKPRTEGHCSVCRAIGHTRRTCPVLRQGMARIINDASE
ncbi:hypothetical protein BDQ12DRAFT_619691, partial [Crucibulum laeve]